eukprot:gene9714-1919_t
MEDEKKKWFYTAIGVSAMSIASYFGSKYFFTSATSFEKKIQNVMTENETDEDEIFDSKDFLPVIITCNLQNDFISLKPKKTFLYIGKDESKRILGDNTAHSPIGQFFQWFRAQNESKIEMIHLKTTWEMDSFMVKKYGMHGIKGTDGQKLIYQMDEKKQKNEHHIEIKSLNVFNDTELETKLQQLEKKHKKKLKIGIVGLWTESTVNYLCYELFSRGYKNVALSSSLTSSVSKLQHYNSLAQIDKIFPFLIFDSIIQFENWLLLNCKKTIPLLSESVQQAKTGHIIRGLKEPLSETHKDIFSFLYRNSLTLNVNQLGGGFSGSAVYLVDSEDIQGHKQSKTILKVGKLSKIVQERVNFEKVEEILTNNAPKILDYVELEEVSAIKFSFASMHGEPVSFKDIFIKETWEDIKNVLNDTFHVLFRLYRPIKRELIDLLEVYDFDGKGWAYFAGGSDTPNKVSKRVSDILNINDGNQKDLKFPDGSVLPNIVEFLEHTIPLLRETGSMKRAHYYSLIHGDLNTGNIMVDSHRNIWIIDFEYTTYGHTLKDVTKLEHDIFYEFTQFNTENELKEGLKIVEFLYKIEDLSSPLPETLEGVKSIHIVKAWNTIRYFRNEVVCKIIDIFRNPIQIFIPLLRYALFSLCLPTLSKNQRILCLAVACGYADRIQKSHRQELHLFMMPKLGKGEFGTTILPGRSDLNRNFDDDIHLMLSQNVKKIICLATYDDFEYKTPNGSLKILGKEFEFVHIPVKNQGVPSVEQTEYILSEIFKTMNEDKKVIIISIAALGRSSVLAALVLMKRYFVPSDQAIKTVKEVRGPRAFESKTQLEFVKNFKFKK